MSLYQRGKSWYYNFTHRGVRYNECIGPVRKTRAKEVEAKKRQEVAEGRFVPLAQKATPRLDVFVPEYLDYYRANRRPMSTRRQETSWHSIEPVLGAKRLDEISARDVERYRRIRQQHGRSNVTINRELAFLRNLFNKAIDWGAVSENPVRKVRFAQEHNQRIRFLTKHEEARLLPVCKDPLRPVVITALHTGFRAGELLSLTWEEVDFDRRLVTVESAYTKNGERRSIPMNEVLHATLEEVRIKQHKAGPVFLSRSGTPYRSFRTAFERAVKRAGITDFHFHDLRHTFASRLVMRGVDLPTVKELMGHKDIKMTLRYTHLSDAHKHEAVRALEFFGSDVRQYSRQGDHAEGGESTKSLKTNMLP